MHSIRRGYTRNLYEGMVSQTAASKVHATRSGRHAAHSNDFLWVQAVLWYYGARRYQRLNWPIPAHFLLEIHAHSNTFNRARAIMVKNALPFVGKKKTFKINLETNNLNDISNDGGVAEGACVTKLCLRSQQLECLANYSFLMATVSICRKSNRKSNFKQWGNRDGWHKNSNISIGIPINVVVEPTAIISIWNSAAIH